MKLPEDMSDLVREGETAATCSLHNQVAPRLRPVVSKGRWEGQALGVWGRKHCVRHSRGLPFPMLGFFPCNVSSLGILGRKYLKTVSELGN